MKLSQAQQDTINKLAQGYHLYHSPIIQGRYWLERGGLTVKLVHWSTVNALIRKDLIVWKGEGILTQAGIEMVGGEKDSQDYIEVDFYVCGVYRGQRRIGRKSLYGQLLSSDFSGAVDSLSSMQSELEQSGCAVRASMKAHPVETNGGDK